MSDEAEFLAVTESDLKDSFDESGKCFSLRDGGRPLDGGASTTVRQLLELQEQVHEDPVRISDNRTFDQLFYAVDSYGSLNAAVRGQLVETLYSILIDVIATIQRTPAVKAFKAAATDTPAAASGSTVNRRRSSIYNGDGSGDGSIYLDSADAYRLRNSAKMSCFLMAWAIRMACRHKKESSSTAPSITGTKKSGKRGSAKDSNAESGGGGGGRGDGGGGGGGDDDVMCGWELVAMREKVLSAVYDLISIDGLGTLWPRGEPDDSFLNVVLGIPFTCIREAGNMKLLSMRRCIGLVLGALSKRYPQQELFVTSGVLELFLDSEKETLAQQLSETFLTVLCDFKNFALMRCIINELLARLQGPHHKQQQQQSQQEGSAKPEFVRNCAVFIAETYKKLPSAMSIIENLPVFMQFLSYDYHALRECTLQVLGECLNKLSYEPLPAVSEEQKASIRADILATLQERFLDISTKTRHKLLQVWCPIVERHLIPVSAYADVAASAVARMDDVNAFVRRAASRLVLILIENNPYAPVLSSGLFHKKKVLCWNILMNTTSHPKASKTKDVAADTIDKKDKNDEGEHSGDNNNNNNEEEEEEIIVSSSYSNDDNSDDNDNDNDDDDEIVVEYIKDEDRFKVLTTDDTELAEFAQKRINSDKVGELFAGTPQQNAPIPASRLLGELVRFYTWATEGERFSKLVNEAFDMANKMLYSRTQLDVTESIKFIVAAKKFKVEGSDAKVKKLFHLVWTKEEPIRKELFAAFGEMYFDKREMHMNIAESIILLVDGSSPSELASLGEIFNCLQARNSIKSGVITTLFDIFSNVENSPAKRRNSLVALEMFAHSADCARMIVKKIGLLVTMTLTPAALHRTPDLAFYTCKLLQKIRSDSVPSVSPATDTTSASASASASASSSKAKSTNEPPTTPSSSSSSSVETARRRKLTQREEVIGRVPNSHKLFRFLLTIFEPYESEEELEYPVWSAIAEQAINAVNVLAENPDQLFEHIVKTLHGSAFGLGAAPGAVSSARVAKLLFAVGHIAVKFLLHIETVKQNMERLSKEKEAAMEAEDGNDDTGDTTSVQPTPRKPGRRGKLSTTNSAAQTPMKKRKKKALNTDDDAQLQITGRRENDIDFERLQASAEEQLAASLVASYTPLVVAVCMNEGGAFNSSYLRAAGVLALSKFMCVAGKKYCESKLRLLVTLLGTAPEPEIRATIVIAMNDLFIRYPNTTEAWTKFLFERLGDVSPEVRRNAISVISHLVLNDLVKLKENAFGLALVLEDEDPEVNKLARLFFTEFSKKGNAIFNELFSLVLQLSAQVKKGMKSPVRASEKLKEALKQYSDSDNNNESKYVMEEEKDAVVAAAAENNENNNDNSTEDIKTEDSEKYLEYIKVDSDVFRSVVGFLFSFLQKEKQIETLMEKLCSNFRDTTSYPEGLAYCLSLFTYTEKTLQRLIDMYGTYQPYLKYDEVYASFRAIVVKATKLQSSEMRAVAEKLDHVIKVAHGDVKASGDDDNELASLSKNSSALSAKTPRKRGQKGGKQKQPTTTTTSSSALKTPATTGRKRRKKTESELDDEEVITASSKKKKAPRKKVAESNSSSGDDSEPHKKKVKTTKKKDTKRKRKKIFVSDDDDDDDDDSGSDYMINSSESDSDDQMSGNED